MKAKTKTFIKKLFTRHQDKISVFFCIRAAFKGFLALTIMSALGYFSQIPLIVASFGASCILIFTTPQDEFSQPANVVGGYLIVGLVGISLNNYLPHEWWSLGLIVGACIASMAIFRVTHPPAGSLPIIIFLSDKAPGYDFLLFPIFAGSVVLVFLAIILNKIPPVRKYPI